MNQDTNNFNQQGNNGMFGNPNQQEYQNMNSRYHQNQNISQDNNVNQSIFNSNLQNNNIYQSPVNQNNILYDNQNKNSKQNKFKIIGIIIIIVVVLFVGIMLFSGSSANKLNGGTKSGNTINIGQELKIKSDYVDINLKAESVERNIKLKNSWGEEETFTKIKLKIVNKAKEETFNDYFIGYELLDQNDNLIKESSCYTERWIGLYEGENLNAIATEIPANSSDKGYLYCLDDSNSGKILRITSFTEFDKELIKQGIIESTAKEEYYINLK